MTDSPLAAIARRYGEAQQNFDTAAENVVVFVSDADGPDDEPQFAVAVMEGRIVEIVVADSLLGDFRGDPVALASYINVFIWRAFDAYAERVGDYIQDGIV